MKHWLTATSRMIKCLQCRRNINSATSRIAVGDRLILRMKEDPSRMMFTKPLRPGLKVQSKWGSIPHDSLIGKSARDVVASSTSREFRIHIPTLEEYVTLTPRLVTPVYPADANLIVSLLDLHVTPGQQPLTSEPLEILEAGTGHGGLTLHLARAIHGANPPPGPQPWADLGERTEHLLQNPQKSISEADGSSSGVDVASDSSPELSVSSEPRLTEVKQKRHAIVHTVDVSALYSQHATTIVQGFRRGIYAKDVEFYVDDVSNWVNEQFRIRKHDQSEAPEKPFLMHAILDLPSSHDHISKIATALHTDGVLIIFNPSITQILECVKSKIEDEIPLWLDRVIELGAGMAGGREWDVRTVKPRALLKAEQARKEAQAAVNNPSTSLESAADEAQKDVSVQTVTRNKELAQAISRRDPGWEMICRPKAGERVVGGGFLGIWRKMGDHNHIEKDLQEPSR